MLDNNIGDNEIRIVGGEKSTHHRIKRRWWISIACVFILGLGMTLFFIRRPSNLIDEHILPDTSNLDNTMTQYLVKMDDKRLMGVEMMDTLVDTIPLRIYIPIHLVPRLEVGYDCVNDTIHNLLFFQAADIRADNGEIVGAFVLGGQPLSWGKSKRGYCGILHDSVHIGVADNSPLFEEATECEGYFFRQYPLVDQGEWVSNPLPSSSIRLGLCEYEDKVIVVESRVPVTLNEFAQLLCQIGIDNAIYLVGSTSIRWCRTMDGVGHASGNWQPRTLKNVNFIVWSEPS